MFYTLVLSRGTNIVKFKGLDKSLIPRKNVHILLYDTFLYKSLDTDYFYVIISLKKTK